MMMMTPVRQMVWAGVFLWAGVSLVSADNTCRLSEVSLCWRFDAGLRLGCAKHAQLALAYCRRAARQERFGSHEDHCRAACRAGVQAVVLDKRLRELAEATAEKSAMGDAAWLAAARSFWQGQGAPEIMCTTTQFKQAQTDCDRQCEVDARRRDLEELQGLAVGRDFLALQQPVFACPPGPATQLLSDEKSGVMKHLYAPGHPRRSGAAAE